MIYVDEQEPVGGEHFIGLMDLAELTTFGGPLGFLPLKIVLLVSAYNHL